MHLAESRRIPFYKMQGSGNDFVLLLNEDLNVPEQVMAEWARKICPRSFAVGADGLIFLEQRGSRPESHFRWHFYNADGSRAEMCGNGSRCAARLAYEIGLAPAEQVFDTDAGTIRAAVDPETGLVKVQLTEPRSLQTHLDLEAGGRRHRVHAVNTGVPHVVLFCERADDQDLRSLGPALRYHERFAPEGANVNLVETSGNGALYVRTYERGVEDETFACGTGAAASATVARELGLSGERVPVRTSGGEDLEILFENGRLFLQGKAELIYAGELFPEAVHLFSG